LKKRKNIDLAIVIGAFPQVSQTFIVRQAIYLNATVYTNNYVQENEKYYNLDKLKIVDVGLNRKSLIFFAFNLYRRIYNRTLKKSYYKWHFLELRKLEKTISKENYTGLIAPFGENGIASLSAARKYNIPLVVQFLGVDGSKQLNNNQYRNDLLPVFDYAKSVIVLSDLLKNNISNAGCPEHKINKINIGLPIADFNVINIKAKHEFVFTAVGRLVEKKSPLDLMKAFEYCSDQNDSVYLRIVGDGPLKGLVKNHLDKSRHKKKIKLYGSCSQDKIREIYNESHVFVQHSVVAADGDSEGWPVAIAEASACGLPVISTRHSGILDLVVHEETGYLVDEHDYESMGKYMLELSLDIDKCIKMGKASREHIEKTGDINDQLRKIKEILLK